MPIPQPGQFDWWKYQQMFAQSPYGQNPYGGMMGAYNGAMGQYGSQMAFAKARNANEQRYQQIVGTGTGAPTGVINGVPQVGIDGKWVPQSQATGEQVNQQVAQQSLFAPAMGGYYGAYSRAMNNVNQMGRQERQDIDLEMNAAQSRGESDLVSRGLSGSAGLTASLKMENMRQRQAMKGRLSDRMLAARQAADYPISQDMLAFMERREDEYPKYTPYVPTPYGGGY